MAEFHVHPQRLANAAAQLDDVASKITNVQKMVASAACGLGPIGIASVGANILAIEARLAANKAKVHALSSALVNIERHYNITEDTIQGQGLIAFIQQLIESASESASAFMDDVQDWIGSFQNWAGGLIGDAAGAWEDFTDTFWNGHFEWNPGFSQGVTLDFLDDLLHGELNVGLLDMDLSHDSVAQLYDENGNLNPQFMQHISGEGSFFALEGTVNIADLISNTNSLTVGEFNIDALVQAGICDSHGNLNPNFAVLTDGEVIMIHDINTTSIGNHDFIVELSVGDASWHAGMGNSVSEAGMAGYVSLTALELDLYDHHGNDYFSTISGVEIQLGTVEAGAGFDVGLLDQNGNFDPHFFLGLADDVSAGSVTAVGGVNLVGTEITVGVSADGEAVGGLGYIYFQDGVLQASLGADWAIGAGLTAEIDFTHTGETMVELYHDVDNNGLSSVVYDTIESQIDFLPEGFIAEHMEGSIVTSALDTAGEVGVGLVEFGHDAVESAVDFGHDLEQGAREFFDDPFGTAAGWFGM